MLGSDPRPLSSHVLIPVKRKPVIMSRETVRVKICGIIGIEDAKMAVASGADALGFIAGVRHKAEDTIGPGQAARIVRNLPPFVSTVLVTHLVEARGIAELVKQMGVTTIQLHDEVPIDEIKSLREILSNIRLIKAVHVTGPEAVNRARNYEGLGDAIVLDSITIQEDRIGGTGLVHDWRISKQIRNQCSLPIILAGGLRPENVEEAIQIVQPYAVDVNSGVESAKVSQGRKDPERLRAFIQKAKKFTVET